MRTLLLPLTALTLLACTGPERRAETTPSPQTGETPAPRSLEAGSYSTCAILDAQVHCWGSNYEAQLALGYITFSKFPPQRTPVPAKGLDGVISLALGHHHGCGLHQDGHVMCWGNQIRGELGQGNTRGGILTTPRAVLGLPKVTTIATGSSHTCAIDEEKSVWCWGNNNMGQLGVGNQTSTGAPVKVDGVRALELSLGNVRSCARTPEGKVLCWGDGPIGDGTDEPSNTPTQVPGLQGVLSLTSGGGHTCARTESAVWCWGDNRNGEIGNGTKDPALTPVQVPGVRNARSVEAGSAHTCATLSDATVTCWGMAHGTSPTPIQGVTDVTSLACGSQHTCVTRTNGSIQCWGENVFGQLGDGTTTARATPADIKR